MADHASELEARSAQVQASGSYYAARDKVGVVVGGFMEANDTRRAVSRTAGMHRSNARVLTAKGVFRMLLLQVSGEQLPAEL